MVRPSNKRQMVHLPPLPACDRASIFPVSAGDDPRRCFAHAIGHHPLAEIDHPTRGSRVVSHQLPESSILIYTDGSCLNQNSKHDVQSRKGGCAVVFGTEHTPVTRPTYPSSFHLRLESQGPDGKSHAATSSHAELRGAIAALECRLWGTEGWRHVNVATDSTYVVNGITGWVSKWKAREWTKVTGEDVVNKDLWVMLVDLVNQQARKGCQVRFWHIKRTQNQRADRWAQVGANLPEVDEYRASDLAKTEAEFCSTNLK